MFFSSSSSILKFSILWSVKTNLLLFWIAEENLIDKNNPKKSHFAPKNRDLKTVNLIRYEKRICSPVENILVDL